MKRSPAFLLILAMIAIATINCKAKSLLDKSIGEEGKGKVNFFLTFEM